MRDLRARRFDADSRGRAARARRRAVARGSRTAPRSAPRPARRRRRCAARPPPAASPARTLRQAGGELQQRQAGEPARLAGAAPRRACSRQASSAERGEHHIGHRAGARSGWRSARRSSIVLAAAGHAELAPELEALAKFIGGHQLPWQVGKLGAGQHRVVGADPAAQRDLQPAAPQRRQQPGAQRRRRAAPAPLPRAPAGSARPGCTAAPAAPCRPADAA